MNIKRIITSAAALAVSAFVFAGCGSADSSSKATENVKNTDSTAAVSADKTIVVGATSTPHGEVLEHVKDALKAKGYTLEIKIYDDYVLPNKALSDKELDANYFQHTPYLNSYNSENGTDIQSAAEIHYEPFGLYGNGVTSVKDIKPGASIVIPADDSNETRALLLLRQEGLIKLPEDASASKGVTTLDIVDDGGYKITTVQADTVAAQFKNSDTGSLAVINGNYALASGLKIKDAIAVEDASGDAAHTYANIIAVRKGDENSEKTKALIEALKTDDVKKFIEEKYNGAVVAIF
ncbi:D-methionine transport system substrate-binding protein [Ruminococcaceae bacterium FB2012]|nr:D-methionine transport system substrate-binding protein [Ruminococcaceae bacterium FB2012]